MAKQKKPIPMMTEKETLENFKGKFCICGHTKKAEQSFCRPHYFALPQYMKNKLWLGWFNGYVGAFTDAARHLGLMENETTKQQTD